MTSKAKGLAGYTENIRAAAPKIKSLARYSKADSKIDTSYRLYKLL